MNDNGYAHIVATVTIGIIVALMVSVTFYYQTNRDDDMITKKSQNDINTLPIRTGKKINTSGAVPHVQVGVDPDPKIVSELMAQIFKLPGVENRPTIVSLPGARGMWLTDDVDIKHAEVIVKGREFAHIHPDGSSHIPLPPDRAKESEDKGWSELHPWANEQPGWEGLVLLFTPATSDDLEIVLQLIVESYNFVTGRSFHPSELK